MSKKKGKVLVTGGAGFIGSHLVRRLVEAGREVSVIDDLSRNVNNVSDLAESGKIDFLKGDIRYPEHIDMAMKGVDQIYHLAAVCINRCKAFPREAIEINLNGSYNVFGAGIRHGVERVVHFSTASVFGEPEYLPMDEKLSHRATEPYGATKSCAEKMLTFLSQKHDLPYVIVRPFNVYGMYQSTDAYYTSVISLFIKRLIGGLPPKINGTGEQSMDFTHVSDIVEICMRILESDIQNEDFNVAPGKEITIKELANSIIKIMDVDVRPEFIDKKVFVSKRRADNRKVCAALDFQFSMDVESGLKELIEHIRNHIDEY